MECRITVALERENGTTIKLFVGITGSIDFVVTQKPGPILYSVFVVSCALQTSTPPSCFNGKFGYRSAKHPSKLSAHPV